MPLPADSLNDLPPTNNAASEAAQPGEGNLALRVLSTLVLAPVALAAVWFGPPYFSGLIAIVALAASAEWRTIAVLERAGLRMILIMVPLFVLVSIEVAGVQTGVIVLVVGLVLTFGTFAAPWNERSWAVVALLHIGVATIAIMFLRTVPDIGRDLVFFLFAGVWLSDIGAYAVGRLVGGPKLAPAISPGKTWAGAIGAVVITLAAAFVYAELTRAGFRAAMTAALLVSVAAQLGDLFESLVKRRFSVKDSGSLIPGHGGVLDRVDGVLFAAPALALFALLFGTDFILWR